MPKKILKRTTALAKWDEKLAAAAAAATETVKNVGGGNVIGTQGGHLSWKGAAIPEDKFRCIILGDVLANLFYEGVFDPNNPASPVCYAFGLDADTLAPHEDSPEKQADSCNVCPQNEWGSANRGRGKACGNKHRLGLIAESDLEDVLAAEVAYIHVPVTSVRIWAGYVRQLSDTLHRPPLGVVTELSLVPSDKNQFDMIFKMVEQIDDGDALEALMEKAELVKKEIEFPYVQITPAEKPQRGRGRAVAPPQRGRSPLRNVVTPAARKGAKAPKFA